MPRRARVRKPKRQTTFRKMVRKYRRRARKPGPTMGRASNPMAFQIFNKTPGRIYKFKDSFQLNDMVGAGVSIPSLYTFQINQIARYTALVSMFRQYRIDFIKVKFRLNNVELTDNAQLPTMYVRYNYDPDLVLAAINENFMMRQQNMVVKQFHHNTVNASLLNYTLKPAVMHAVQLYNSTSFVPTPKWNAWCDFDPSGTLEEINHYGIQVFTTNLPTGINVNVDCEFHYSCRDVI